ncbi:MAG: winged helix-turn-helix domain-containing protein, partial [Pseudomonadota bacterium]
MEARPFKVAEWTVEPDLGRLTRGKEQVTLRPQVMDLLVYLAKKPGQVAGIEELMATLWVGKYVTEGTLYNCVGELRQALGDDQEYVATITRKGYRLVAPVTGLQDQQVEAKSNRLQWLALVAASAVVIAAVLIFFRSGEPEPKFQPPINSIAVLPLMDMSSDSTKQYLGDGLSEALIHQLAQVPELSVIARTSSFSFRGSDLDAMAIGRELNVALLLEGSVHVEDGKLRVFAQLIEAQGGSHVWSDKLERDNNDLFSLQDEIALAVANRVTGLSLSKGDLAYAAATTPTPVAYELYVQGLYQLNTLFAPGQANVNMNAPVDALEFFQRATEVDPSFALAWAARARALFMLMQMEKVTPMEAGPQFQEFLGQAMRLGSGLAEVQFTAGLLTPGPQSLQFLDQAIAINPNHSNAHVQRGSKLLEGGQYRAAFESLAIASSLDPLNGMAVEGALYASFYQGDWEDLDKRIAASNRLWPEANGLTTEAHLMFELGRLDRFAELERTARKIPGYGIKDWFASAPRHFGDTYLTLGLDSLAAAWFNNPEMVASYQDVMLLREGKYEDALVFLLSQMEQAQGRPPHAFRGFPDIAASIVEVFLYQGNYQGLTEFLDQRQWGMGLYPLPNCCATNPPWPEVAYAFALTKTGQQEASKQWVDTLLQQLEHRLRQGIKVPNHYYELARLQAIQGNIQDAYAALEQAIDLGWRRWYFERDPILEPIRELP